MRRAVFICLLALAACTTRPTLDGSLPTISLSPSPSVAPSLQPNPSASFSPRPQAATPTLSEPTPPPAPTSPPELAPISPSNAAELSQIAQIQYSPWELVLSLGWSPDSQTLGVAAGEKVHLYDGNMLQEQATLNVSVWTPSLAFNPQGTLLATGSRDGFLRVWNLQNGQLVQTLQAHQKGVNSVLYSPAGDLLASGGNDAIARLWDSASGEPLGQMIGGTYSVPSIAFTPDGSALAIANGNVIRLREVSDQRFVSTFRGQGSFYTIAFSPDGHLLAAGDNLGKVSLWEVGSATLLRTFTSYNPQSNLPSTLVWDVAFSPDGQLLASASGDGRLRIWNVITGQALLTLAGHTKAATCLAFSPDGRHLASGGLDGTLQLWGIRVTLGTETNPH